VTMQSDGLSVPDDESLGWTPSAALGETHSAALGETPSAADLGKPPSAADLGKTSSAADLGKTSSAALGETPSAALGESVGTMCQAPGFVDPVCPPRHTIKTDNASVATHLTNPPGPGTCARPALPAAVLTETATKRSCAQAGRDCVEFTK